MDNIQFGQFVAHLRKEKNITQKELADRLHVTDKAVSKWETGKGFPDLKLLEPLAQELGVSLVELLQGSAPPPPPSPRRRRARRQSRPWSSPRRTPPDGI